MNFLAHQGLSRSLPVTGEQTLMFPHETKLHSAGNTLLNTLGDQGDHSIIGRDQNVTFGGWALYRPARAES